MDLSKETTLGKKTEYPEKYSASWLTPISRQLSRQTIGVGQDLPFNGVDIWNAYEVSWLNGRGKPQVALGVIELDCASKNIIESKSLKLYLNSLNQTIFADLKSVEDCLQRDLTEASEGQVKVTLSDVNSSEIQPPYWQKAICIDELDVACNTYTPDKSLLSLADDEEEGVVSEMLSSNLLKSNCPVTGQPDWATLYVQYTGRRISHAGLLQYIVSMRGHQDFHEHCVESVYMAFMERCQPEKLAVYARYTRRGGLDINPLRSNFVVPYDNVKLPRQ